MRRVLQFLLVLGLACTGSSQTGSEICATCHAAIYGRYRRTPMAHSARKLDASASPERFDKASFTHAPSGFRYRDGLELVRLNLAVAFLRIGDRISAGRHLRKALELNPAFAPARELLNKLQTTALK